MRLTKDVRRQLLEQNDGFSTKTSYEGKNSSEDRTYTIKDGALHVQASGKTSWADSRYKNEFVADEEQTHRYLRNNLYKLNKDDVDESVVQRTTRPSGSVPVLAPQGGSVKSDDGGDDYYESDASSESQGSGLEKSTVIALIVVAVVLVVGAIAFFVAKPLWRDRIKPFLEQKRAMRAQRKADKARRKQIED
ncbi:hypothetical protein [Microcella sp.]|uniref:hypothetical protein n=1 Tax=Microcella sp. TaxID=1913979 RepID=UPI002568FDA8|nr:hypothetical protein [Microcella sp.]MBX9470364.1 hypothetical protein [Microcella sp.]